MAALYCSDYSKGLPFLSSFNKYLKALEKKKKEQGILSSSKVKQVLQCSLKNSNQKTEEDRFFYPHTTAYKLSSGLRVSRPPKLQTVGIIVTDLL